MARTSRWPVLPLVLAAAASVAAQPATARTYHNSQFGLTVLLPDRLPGCWAEPGYEDHGFDVLLNPMAKDGCDELETSRHLSVFADDNFLHRTLERVFRDECAEGPKGRCLPAPAQLDIKGWPSRAGWTYQPGGWINVRIVAQAPGSPGGSERQGDVYIFTLHTTRGHRNEDLALLRRIMASVRIERVPRQGLPGSVVTSPPPPAPPPSPAAVPSSGPPGPLRAGA